ncbi:lysosomal acid phosphatase-like [Diorhabda sublineata]|uniref:lysosomal acid phosphatase-like n=1 Tax=Diorhabda sublineata TaxID=1163346 RepID=UPI0024E11014|nr:lysosomal acid phosphatase-like [Diorhabda sublineata]
MQHFLASAVLLVTLIAISVSGELIAVVQIFRHGHRTPGSSYSTDPYEDRSYWDGLAEGQLTNVGKRQHFALGQYTRRRYHSFLPAKYNKTMFYAQTTDVDRTHMSAQSNVYGLYPAAGSQVWRKGVDWQAIPIHPANSSIFDSSFYPSDCAAYTPLLTAVLNSEEYEELNEKYSDLYAYLTEHSGDNITDFTETYTVWDCLKSEDTAGFKLPPWTRSVYPEPLRTVAGKIFEVFSHTKKMRRFVSGLFLNEVVEYLESMAEDSSASQKFMVYSGHDTNIAATLNSFGVFDPPYPPEYASTIYIELHKVKEYIVKVFIKDDKFIKQISVNGCDLNCPLSEFRNKLSDYILDAETWNEECAAASTGGKYLPVGQYSQEKIFEKWGGKST